MVSEETEVIAVLWTLAAWKNFDLLDLLVLITIIMYLSCYTVLNFLVTKVHMIMSV